MNAERLVSALRAHGWTVATAESMTAGLVSSAIAEVPGCSDVLVGGVAAYAPSVKTQVLHVPSLATGLVSHDVAVSMAAGIRELMGVDVGISVTGAAGPEPHDGAPVGSVWISVITPVTSVTRHVMLSGDRDAIRAQACLEAVVQAWRAITD